MKSTTPLWELPDNVGIPGYEPIEPPKETKEQFGKRFEQSEKWQAWLRHIESKRPQQLS